MADIIPKQKAKTKSQKKFIPTFSYSYKFKQKDTYKNVGQAFPKHLSLKY